MIVISIVSIEVECLFVSFHVNVVEMFCHHCGNPSSVAFPPTSVTSVPITIVYFPPSLVGPTGHLGIFIYSPLTHSLSTHYSQLTRPTLLSISSILSSIYIYIYITTHTYLNNKLNEQD